MAVTEGVIYQNPLPLFEATLIRSEERQDMHLKDNTHPFTSP
jgi:hypothetical protein